MDLTLKKLGQMFARTTERAPATVVGVDFGSSSIKVVELKQEGETVSLVTYGELQLGPYAQVAIGRATNLDQTQLTAALKDIIREAQVSGTLGGVAVPYASSFVTVIAMPMQDPKMLGNVIPIEARKYVPVPINQVTLDWFQIPVARGEANDGRLRVLLAAIHNEALAKYHGAIGGVGMRTLFTEVEIFSTIRSSVPTAQDTVMVIDIGAATSKLYVVSGGIVQHTHSVTVGGQDLTSSLSKSLEISVDQAEEIKRQIGLNTDDQPKIERAMSLPLERIFVDARRLLALYERGEQVAPVSSIVLSGGGSTLRGLESYAQNALGRRIVRADPFAKVLYPAFLEGTLKEIGPAFAVALGVALRALSEA